jgi:hypothetical protein
LAGCLLWDGLKNSNDAWLAAAVIQQHAQQAPTSHVCPLRWWSLPVRLTMQHSRRSSSLAAATVAFLLGVLVICVNGQCRHSGWKMWVVGGGEATLGIGSGSCRWDRAAGRRHRACESES